MKRGDKKLGQNSTKRRVSGYDAAEVHSPEVH